MPELPEVETTRRGVAPHVIGRRIVRVDVRESRLRWPVPDVLVEQLPGQRFTAVGRRAKYLLFQCESGVLLVHLGMSGSLRLTRADEPPGKHAHVDIAFETETETDAGMGAAAGAKTGSIGAKAVAGAMLRYTDPRRFGSMHWQAAGAGEHPLLRGLGPEPLGDEFDGALLHRKSRGRKTAVKHLIMDSRIVAGVGNIYACEALFLAGIHPARACGRISAQRYEKLAGAIRSVLGEAICAGGTSLRDFTGGDGRPGYFRQRLNVYGREGESCARCSGDLRELRLGQRATVYCPSCQT